MERVSQLILRNAKLFHSGQVLLINPPADSCHNSLSKFTRQVNVFSQNHSDYSYFISSGIVAHFGLIPSLSSVAQDIVFILPRERERLDMMLHAIATDLNPDSILWLAGENRSGIKSSARRLSPYFQSVSKIDNARHCTLYRASKPNAPTPFKMESYKKTWSLTYSETQINIISLPGTFSHGKLDKGTKLLLSTLEKLKPEGSILDFACGSGVIGLSVQQFNSAGKLTLLDVSALALESARHSLKVNGITASLVTSDGLSQLEGRFDWIVSNPPFHQGIKNDLNVTRLFFADAANFLTETGKILLVCNKHLPYVGWLKDYFKRVDLLESGQGFRVILASNLV